MEAVLGVVLTGIAAIITASAALVKAARWANKSTRAQNRALHEYREAADRVIRLQTVHLRRHGIEDSPDILDAMQDLEEARDRVDQGENE